MNIVDLVLSDLAHILCNFCTGRKEYFERKDRKQKISFFSVFISISFHVSPEVKNARTGYVHHCSVYSAPTFYHFHLQFGFVEFDHVSDPSLDSQETRLASAASAESVCSSCPLCVQIRIRIQNTCTDANTKHNYKYQISLCGCICRICLKTLPLLHIFLFIMFNIIYEKFV